ncbi:MAG: diguanylate cyclase [Candidatus Omnitrophota bacterium]
MARATIQSRISTFMIIFTLVLIGAFAAIQVYNQLATMTAHNHLRARLGAGLAKISLEEALLKAATKTLQRDLLESTLQELSEGKIMDTGKIYLADGTSAAASDPREKSVPASGAQKRQIGAALKGLSAGKWFSSEATEKVLDVYIPLQLNGVYDYIACLSFSLGNMLDALKEVYVPSTITAFLVILLNTGLGLFLQKTIIGPLKTLDRATKVISEGELEQKVDIKTGDELEDLATRFNDMSAALIKMRERALNASPLTKLPGNVMIAEDVERRILESKKFVTVHTDLDNFKAYNDKYGLANGDEAIKLTAQVIREALKQKGSVDDFVGHEGGDDFVLVTTPEKVDGVTEYIKSEFDKRIRALYSEEDLQKGHIISKSRAGEITKFPIMSISMAGVSNQSRPIQSYAQVTNIAAEVKKKAKSVEGSAFVLDKRLDDDA